MFKFKSDLVLSKSWLNRALIIQSYAATSFEDLNSDSDDVVCLKQALQQMKAGQKEFYLGQGGTSFRFFCFLISRQPGNWVVKAHPRLLERPQQGLRSILQQLGVQIEFEKEKVVIRSEGWKIPTLIECRAEDSSQFISGLLLNAWNLPKDLNIKIHGPIVSAEYFKMTTALLKQFGLQIDEASTLRILKNQIPQIAKAQPEVDVSSAFSLAAAGIIDGEVEITNWNPTSLQPDIIFLKIFDQMGISYSQTENKLKIAKHAKWNGAKVNLNHSPDLFPVLSVLCALADGPSNLFGAEQLKYKESDRLKKTKQLLDLLDFQSELRSDGLKIEGLSSKQDKNKNVIFDPDHDHRMAMAAGLFKLAGFAIQIKDPAVVNKSYHSFWKDTGIEP